MKYNRIVLICSAIAAILSLTLYSVFGYVRCVQNEYVADISLAVLGSAVLLIVSSWVGYWVEKKHLQEDILSYSDKWRFSTDIMLEIKNNNSSKNFLLKIIDNSFNNFLFLYRKLRHYYLNLFIKDKKLKNLIVTMYEYARLLTIFEIHLMSSKITADEIMEEYQKLTKQEEEVYSQILTWMEEANFELGKPFEIKETEETQNI